jgi:hypothetical protein
MSGAADGRQWADEIGAAGYVGKPFDIVDMVSQIERLVPPR